MVEVMDEDSDVGIAEHDGDIRIYQLDDTEIWLQCDVSVDEVLDETDADPTYIPVTQDEATTSEEETDE